MISMSGARQRYGLRIGFFSLKLSRSAVSLSQYSVTLPEEMLEVAQIQCRMKSAEEIPHNSDLYAVMTFECPNDGLAPFQITSPDPLAKTHAWDPCPVSGEYAPSAHTNKSFSSMAIDRSCTLVVRLSSQSKSAS